MGLVFNSGNLSFADYFKINTSAPIDSRLVVLEEADLWTNNTWNGYAYKGMIVTVASNSKIYLYIGNTGDDSNSTGTKNSENWKLVNHEISFTSSNGVLTINKDGVETTLSLKDKVVSAGSVKNIESVSESGTVAYYTQGNKAFKIDNKFIYKETVDNTYKYYIIYNTDDKVYLTDLTESTLPSDIAEKSYIFLTIADGGGIPVIIPASSLVEYISLGTLTGNSVQLTLENHLLTASLSETTSLKLDTAYNSATTALQEIDITVEPSDISSTDTTAGAKAYSATGGLVENNNATSTSDTVKIKVFNGNIGDSYINRQYTTQEIENEPEGSKHETTKYYHNDGLVTAANVKSYVNNNLTSALTWDD